MRNNPLLKQVISAIAELTSQDKSYVTEAELAQKVQVSRTRLRETLQTLNAFGIIEKRQKLGVALKPVTEESINETYELRELLEAQAIQGAMRHITPKDIEQLRNHEKTIEMATQMGDWNMAAEYDLKFHHTIIDISNLPLLKRVLDNLHLIENSFAKGATVLATDNNQWQNNDPNPYSHQAIVDALEKGDKKCIRLLRKHIEWIKKEELLQLKKRAQLQ